MSLAMIGSKSAFEFRWRRWALLRDTVLFLEPTPGRFGHFHSVGDAGPREPRRARAVLAGSQDSAAARWRATRGCNSRRGL